MVNLSSKRTAEETRALLDAADALAEFLGIDPEEVEDFRRRHPKFVPEVWWTLADNYGELIWSAWKGLLAVEWGRFSIYTDRTLALLTMWSSTEPSTTTETELTGVFTPTLYPYQRAILFLAVESWRAKVCQECGHAFVADHASRKYCSIASSSGINCSALVIKRTGLEWGRKNNWGRNKSTKKSARTR
jgi:hypothetical protein